MQYTVLLRSPMTFGQEPHFKGMHAKSVGRYKRKCFFSLELERPRLVRVCVLVVSASHQVRHLADPVVWIFQLRFVCRRKNTFQNASRLVVIFCHFFPVYLSVYKKFGLVSYVGLKTIGRGTTLECFNCCLGPGPATFFFAVLFEASMYVS